MSTGGTGAMRKILGHRGQKKQHSLSQSKASIRAPSRPLERRRQLCCRGGLERTRCCQIFGSRNSCSSLGAVGGACGGWGDERATPPLLQANFTQRRLPPPRNFCSFNPFIASITRATSMTSGVSGFGDSRSTKRPWSKNPQWSQYRT